MIPGDFVTIGQVGDRARDFEHAVVSSRAELQVSHGELHQLKRGLIQRAEGLISRLPMRALQLILGLFESVLLTLTRCNHPAINSFDVSSLRSLLIFWNPERHSGDSDMQVDAG